MYRILTQTARIEFIYFVFEANARSV